MKYNIRDGKGRFKGTGPVEINLDTVEYTMSLVKSEKRSLWQRFCALFLK